MVAQPPRRMRFTKANPCPVCGGFDQAPRGKGIRCWGYRTGDSVVCVRKEYAGTAEYQEGAEGWRHRLAGACPCGIEHEKSPPRRNNGRDSRTIDVAYGYEDADRQLSYQVVRLTPKGFFQRRPDGNGGWINNLDGVDRIPYRLPELLEAPPDELVFIPEGEKDVDRLMDLGLVATTNPQGAGKWLPHFAQYFLENEAVLLPDNDDQGREHASQVAANVVPVAPSVRILELPGLPDKGDVSNWLDAGGTVEQLLELAGAAPPLAPSTNGAKPDAPMDENHFTDMGNARRLVAQHGNDFRFDTYSKGFLVWDRKRWSSDATLSISRMAKNTVLSLYEEVRTLLKQATEMKQAGSSSEALDSKVKETLAWAKKSESARLLNAMIETAKSEPGVPVTPAQMDTDPWALNVLNGTIDLRNGQVRPHRREDLISRLAPVQFDPDARFDLWDRFLTEAIPDEATRAYVQRVAGVSLVGGLQDEDLMILIHGPGGTGKSTFREALMGALGDYTASVDLETFKPRNGADSASEDLARLAGRRLVAVSEVEGQKDASLALLKRATGGDTLQARFLYGHTFEYVPQYTLWIVANERPSVSASDSGAWRRIREIPFEARFGEPDPSIRRQLRDPRTAGAAILAWAVQGCLDWQRVGLGDIPRAVRDATTDYQLEMNPLADWLEERTASVDEWTATKELRADYEKWAEESNIRRTLGPKKFSQTLGVYFTPERDSSGNKRGFRGVRLL